MSRVGVAWDLARGRVPRGDQATAQRVVHRFDDALVGLFLCAVTAVLTLVRGLVLLHSDHPDRWAFVVGGVLVLLVVVVAEVRRRVLATARRSGHPPRQSWR